MPLSDAQLKRIADVIVRYNHCVAKKEQVLTELDNAMQSLLNNPVNPKFRDAIYLHLACFEGSDKLTSTYLKLRAYDPLALSYCFATSIVIGDVDLVRLFIEIGGIDVNKPVVQADMILVDDQLVLDYSNKNDMLPIAMVASREHEGEDNIEVGGGEHEGERYREVMKYFLSLPNIEVNKPFDSPITRNVTALYYATASGDVEIARLLLEKGANPYVLCYFLKSTLLNMLI